MASVRARKSGRTGSLGQFRGGEVESKPSARSKWNAPGQPGAEPTLRLTEVEEAYVGGLLLVLTPREREVVFALCTGGTNEDMADRMCIAMPTLRTHLMRLNQKLGTSSKGDVVRLVAAHVLEAYRKRVLEPAPSSAGAPSCEGHR